MSESSNGHGNSDVQTLIVTMTIQPDHEQEFVQLASSVIQTVHAEETDTILYTLHKHPTEPHTYVWVERYADADAMQRHAAAPYMAEAMGKIPGWLAKPPEFTQLSQILPA